MRGVVQVGQLVITLTVIGCVTWLASVGKLSADAAVAVMLAAAGIGSAAHAAERTVERANGGGRPPAGGGGGAS